MDFEPDSLVTLRVLLLLLAFATLFVVRALAAVLWRTWRRRRQAHGEDQRPAPTAATRR